MESSSNSVEDDTGCARACVGMHLLFVTIFGLEIWVCVMCAILPWLDLDLHIGSDYEVIE